MATSVARSCIIDYDATGNARAITIDGKKYTTGISDIPSNYQAKNGSIACTCILTGHENDPTRGILLIHGSGKTTAHSGFSA